MANEAPGYQTTHFSTTHATTADWVEVPFGFSANTIYFNNTGGQSAELSFDNSVVKTVHRTVPAAGSFQYDYKRASSVFVRQVTSTTNLDIEAW